MKNISGLSRNPEKTVRSRTRAFFVGIVAACCLLSFAVPASALSILINDFGDLGDADLGNPACATTSGNCTLRAAIEQINFTADSSNTVEFSPIMPLPATILLGNNLPIITSSMSITGPGSDLLTIDGQGLYSIFVIDSPGDNSALTITDLRLIRGLAHPWNGGAVNAATGDSLSLTGMVLENNSAATSGGAVYCNDCGTLSMSHCRLSGNTATYLGGGVFAQGAIINVDHSVFEGNVGLADFNGGGGMTVLSGTGSITDSVFEGNEAADGGGGLYFDGVTDGTLSIRDSRFTGNVAGDAGGGLYLGGAGSSVLERVTVSGNIALSGGGILASYQSVSIANSTISGNAASFSGGGVDAQPSSTVRLSNVTITGNTADTGEYPYDYCLGGGLSSAGALTLENTVIAGNKTFNPGYTTGSDCYSSGSTSSGGYNVIGDGSGGCVFVAEDQVGTTGSPIAPLLASLAWNGGSTPTHALLSGSPAVDNGNPGGCTWDDDADGGTTPEVALTEDQRTASRPYPDGGRCDVGAYEWTHCDNGIMDNDETGIDCGGGLCAACSCSGTDAKILAAGFSTIQDAYDAAWDSAVIRARETDTGQSLVFGRAIYVTLRGGHDCDFFRIKGMTSVASLTVSAGRLTVENIAIGGP